MFVAYFLMTRSGSTLRGELRDFAIEDTGAIERIFIADKLGHNSLLERKGTGYWTVNDKYTARQDAVKNLLITLSKMKVKAPVAESMEANVLKDLSGPVQRKVEVYAGGRRIKTFYVGGETIDKNGTFMLLEHSSKPFEVYVPGHKGFLQTRFITDERIWRDQSIFALEKNAIRSITVQNNEQPENSFQIEIPDKGSPVLKGPKGAERADTLLLNQYITQYRRMGFEYVITDETFPASRKDSILSAQPFVDIKVLTRKGETKHIQAYRRIQPLNEAVQIEGDSPYDPERAYALIDGKDFVLVQYFQLDRLLVPGGYFVK